VATVCNFEIDAVAGAISSDVHRRAAETVVLTTDWLAEEGRELNQMQKVELVQTAIRCFDGVEATVRREIERQLEPIATPSEGFLRLVAAAEAS
jgi:hypothetical protein